MCVCVCVSDCVWLCDYVWLCVCVLVFFFTAVSLSRHNCQVRDKEAARENIEVARSEEPRLITQALTEKREAETEASITLDKATTNARCHLPSLELIRFIFDFCA